MLTKLVKHVEVFILFYLQVILWKFTLNYTPQVCKSISIDCITFM